MGIEITILGSSGAQRDADWMTGVQVYAFHEADFFMFNSIVKREYYYGESEDAKEHETRLFILSRV